ncbi:hypothetical protein VTO42DRAFT_3809 [Malbranchea cinnamomea]
MECALSLTTTMLDSWRVSQSLKRDSRSHSGVLKNHRRSTSKSPAKSRNHTTLMRERERDVRTSKLLLPSVLKTIARVSRCSWSGSESSCRGRVGEEGRCTSENSGCFVCRSSFVPGEGFETPQSDDSTEHYKPDAVLPRMALDCRRQQSYAESRGGQEENSAAAVGVLAPVTGADTQHVFFNVASKSVTALRGPWEKDTE